MDHEGRVAWSAVAVGGEESVCMVIVYDDIKTRYRALASPDIVTAG
ncbi:hypothetical protein AA18895_1598 [Acetobacter ghanensis DSM 18895]|nr:hypothetical protein AA18895_1598 [Acetobacter ghanensis DSM 18895]